MMRAGHRLGRVRLALLTLLLGASSLTALAGSAAMAEAAPGTAYVTNEGSGSVTPIEVATNKPGAEIKVGGGPEEIAITPDGKTVYVVNLIAGTVTPISTATNTPGRPVVVKSSPGVLLDGIGIAPDGRTAYILNEIFEPASFPGTVIPLRTATNTLGKPITVGTAPSAIVFAR